MPNKKIIYLINPISGTRGKRSLHDLITRRTQEAGIEFSILPTDAAGNYSFLIPLIETEKVTDIVICGGDGTVSAVAAELKGRDTRIGIIPMGSGNGLAFAAGIPSDPAKAMDIILAGNASWIDGFSINGRFSCMLCGIGFDGGVAHLFARENRRGLQTYIKVTLSYFLRARSYPFTIDLPASSGTLTSFPVEAFFIDIANGNQFGNNVTIAPRADLHDGLLDIVIVKKASRLRLLLSAIRQVMGGYKVTRAPVNAGTKKVLYFQTPGLVIANPEGAPLHIDGDPAPSANRFLIEVAPKAIRLIQP
ncbi:MAG TPA: diacylglycerol kinase family protein [Puia sp.]|jgi:YegS/Rv2252/BmrU family lipid kinase|nr:diacylglycerol kinase family protein [Puia sp.]